MATMCNASRVTISPSRSTTARERGATRSISGWRTAYSRPSEVRSANGWNPPPEMRKRIRSRFMPKPYRRFETLSNQPARKGNSNHESHEPHEKRSLFPCGPVSWLITDSARGLVQLAEHQQYAPPFQTLVGAHLQEP